MSGVGSSTMSGTPSCFFILPVGGHLGTEVGDGGGHDDRRRRRAWRSTAACIWAAVSTGSTRDAGRHRQQLDGAHQHDVGPAAAASAATA